jgi:hypothetical protein
MIRSGCIGLCAGLALSLFALGCGSSTSSSSSAPWDEARVGSTATGWWMNAVKGKLFLSVKLGHSELSDTAGRDQTIAITKTVAGKAGSSAMATMPAANELPGSWVIDPDANSNYTANGPALATTFEKATEYIDGGADPYYPADKTYKATALAWANFKENNASKDSPYTLDLKIWEMGSAADTKTLYTDLLSNSLYSPNNVPWKECTGDATNPCP